MKEIKVSVNTWYVVEGTAGATVTNPSTNRVIATIEDGKQTSFYATTPYVLASDDSVSVYKATFNSAPAKLRLLGLLGGGASTGSGSVLPEGYLAAEFIENTKNYKIELPFAVDTSVDTLKIETVAAATATGTTRFEGVEETSDVLMGQANANNAMLCQCGGLWATGGSYSSGFHTWTLEIDKLNLRGCVDGVEVINKTMKNQPAFTVYYLFTVKGSESLSWITKKKNWKAWKNGQLAYDLIPALGLDGICYLFNKLSGEFFTASMPIAYAGFSLAQARKLGELPKKTSWLGLSLPVGYESDSEVMSALETARAKGWNLEIRTYTAESTTSSASTFGMRRIWVRRSQDEHGMYVDADGTRWHVDWCAAMYNHDNSTPDQHGYELFRSQDAAVEYWGLTPWVDPEVEKLMQEELLTEYNANE